MLSIVLVRMRTNCEIPIVAVRDAAFNALPFTETYLSGEMIVMLGSYTFYCASMCFIGTAVI